MKLQTKRLTLRSWKKTDYGEFAKLNSDPEVMKYFPATLSREESDSLADRISTLIDKNGYGFWAVEEHNASQFIGFVGLNIPAYELPVKPCMEVGWRLARPYWGQGYATEAANASLDFAFTELEQKNVYSFTAVPNIKSRAVMQRIGMQNTNRYFEHPEVPENHPLREHVLYKIDCEQWKQKSH